LQKDGTVRKLILALIVFASLTACANSHKSEDVGTTVISTPTSTQPNTPPASAVRTMAWHPTPIADYEVNGQRPPTACEEAFFAAEQALGFPNAGMGHNAIYNTLMFAQGICGKLQLAGDIEDLDSMGQELTNSGSKDSVEITQAMGEGLVRAAVTYICPQYKQMLR
jgi:hypothetical protein